MSFRIAAACMCAIVCGLVSCAATSAEESTPPDIALTADQPAIRQRLDAIVDARRHSSDLRLRILYSWGIEVEPRRRPEDNGFYAKEHITAADLYEQARGSTDPLVLDLLIHRCSMRTITEAACDREVLARRWTEVETQNQVAWLTLASVLKDSGDLAGSRDAFERASRVSYWHEHYVDVGQLLAGSLPRDLSIRERGAALVEAFGHVGVATAGDALLILATNCREEDPPKSACARIVATLARDTDTLLAMSLAVRLGVRAGLDPTTIASYQHDVDSVRWASSKMYGNDDAFESDDDVQLAAQVERMRLLIDQGERRRAMQVLRDQRVTRNEAAARYVANLSKEELTRRATLLRGG